MLIDVNTGRVGSGGFSNTLEWNTLKYSSLEYSEILCSCALKYSLLHRSLVSGELSGGGESGGDLTTQGKGRGIRRWGKFYLHVALKKIFLWTLFKWITLSLKRKGVGVFDL